MADEQDKIDPSEYWPKLMTGNLGDRHDEAAWTMFLRVCVPLTMRMLFYQIAKTSDEPDKEALFKKLTETMLQANRECFMDSMNQTLKVHTDMLEDGGMGKIFGTMVPDSEEVRVKSVAALNKLESFLKGIILADIDDNG